LKANNRIYSSETGASADRRSVAWESSTVWQMEVPMELTITQEDKGAGRSMSIGMMV
jgi:hypothetical protein